jgi:hypothetical protein
MDPNATLRTIIDAIADQDTDATIDATTDLLGWLLNGGFGPAGYRRADVAEFCRQTLHRAGSEDVRPLVKHFLRPSVA